MYVDIERGKVLVAILSRINYDCKRTGSIDFINGIITFVNVLPALDWIYSSIDRTDYRHHPYFVQIVKRYDPDPQLYEHHCNGVFVARDIVLTSVDCMYDRKSRNKLDISSLKIKYGTSSAGRRRGDTQDWGDGFHLDILDFHTHWDPPGIAGVSKLPRPAFNPFGEFALVVFKRPTTFNYQWLSLPRPEESLLQDEQLTIVTIGRSDEKSILAPKFPLKQATMHVEDCFRLSRQVNNGSEDSWKKPYHRLCMDGGWDRYRTCQGDLK